MQNFEPRNFRIDNVELNWAKLVTPVSPFGQAQYELQIATTNKAQAEEWKANHLNVKPPKEGSESFTVSLKRKAMKADGSDNGAPRVVGSDAQPIDAGKLGNGSTGNVIIYQMYYKNAGREGISNSLTAVQVTDFQEYTGSADFEPIMPVDAPVAAAAADAPADPF